MLLLLWLLFDWLFCFVGYDGVVWFVCGDVNGVSDEDGMLMLWFIDVMV